jgi:hypothetical protein
VRESVRQGPEALAWESIDVWLPWGFRAADIATEVHVWHGEQDTIQEQEAEVRFVVIRRRYLHLPLGLWGRCV